jgi:Zn-dependent protease with chaperone function
MHADRFQAMVTRLERDSATHPRGYVLRVALLALLGFALLAALMVVAGAGLLVLLGIAVALLFTGGAAWIALLKFGKLLILLAVPLWVLLRSSLKALFVRLPTPQGELLTRRQAPSLFTAIDTLRQRLRGPAVHQVLLVDEVNAAIVQRPLFGLFGFPRNHLLLGLPLLESMTPDEALAVVAHEYGHLAGSHGHFAAFIYRLRLSWGPIEAAAAQWQGGFGRWLGSAVAWYAPYFNAYTFVLARANEFQADRAAADLVGPPVVAAALKRANLAGPQYQAFIGNTLGRIGEHPRPPADLAQRWAAEAATVAPPAQRWLADALDRRGQVADTHPVLRERLQALAIDGAVADLPPPRSGPSAAEAWLGAALPDLRRLFQARWADAVARPWAERHEQILAQRARLAELRGLAGRSVAEEFERLRLAAAMDPTRDHREDVAAFNAAHADHAGGVLLEATLRLDRDDEAGLALLERAIALDASASLAAAERAHDFCRARQDEAGARQWAARWQQRRQFERDRQRQASTLDTAHALRPAALDAATAASFRDVLARVERRGIAALYLVRRVLPADPALPTYVLGVDLSWWARRRGRQQQLVDRLVALQWPLHMIVCTLDGGRKRYGKTLRAVEGARLA